LGRVKADIAVSGLVERLLKKPGHSAKLMAALPGCSNSGCKINPEADKGRRKEA